MPNFSLFSVLRSMEPTTSRLWSMTLLQRFLLEHSSPLFILPVQALTYKVPQHNHVSGSTTIIHKESVGSVKLKKQFYFRVNYI